MVSIVGSAWFFRGRIDFPLIDVRSPSEYQQGHIPEAINIPLFTDEERAAVGKRYHDAGKEAAMLIGMDFAGPKMSDYVKKLNSVTKGKKKEIVLYCWRGGMRSASMAWLFSIAGYQALVIDGGYKAYRAYIREQSGMGAPMMVLGGMTGSGKTEILHELAKRGEQVIDLEGIAHNKGSVFGYLGQLPQPTNEQFENNLFKIWNELDHSRPVWIEDESRSIGAVSLPGPFFSRMKQSLLVLLSVSIEARVERLSREYAGFEKAALLEALAKISQSIGGKGVEDAGKCILAGDFTPAIRLVLEYYDKTYNKALLKYSERPVKKINSETGEAVVNAAQLMNALPELMEMAGYA